VHNAPGLSHPVHSGSATNIGGVMNAGTDIVGYKIFGNGPRRAIALHGWLGDLSVFNPVLWALDPGEVSLALMDYRGYGSSKSLTGPFDIATIARDALALADHLGWARFAVIGHSMGGKAALRVAADAPQRVQSILAITPVWAGKVPFDADTLALFRGAVHELDLRETIISNTTSGRWPTAWSRRIAQNSLEVSRVEAVASYLESWAMSDFTDACAALDTSVTVVIGAHDRGVPLELVSQTWLKELAHSRLIALPECGHYPMLECPPALGVVFQDFIRA